MATRNATTADYRGEPLATPASVTAPLETKNPCSSLKIDIRMSGLPIKVVAKEVFGFLDRQTILSCFKVEELCNHYDLKDHYCTDHGSKLESQVARRKDLDELAGHGGNREPGMEEQVECEDCVEAEYDNVRCPHCDSFASLDETEKCDECGWKFCNSCRKAMDSFGQCEICWQTYCGEQGCNKVIICEGCSMTLCSNCCAIGECDRCGKIHGCDRCCVDTLYKCRVCGSSFCCGCKEWFYCTLCQEEYCVDCFDGIHCSSCNESHCAYCAYAHARSCDCN